jgi:hypothetical protein
MISNTGLNIEHGIKAFVQLGRVSNDTEDIKEALSRILEFNSNIYILQKEHSLLDDEVIYLRDMIDKESREIALKMRDNILHQLGS